MTGGRESGVWERQSSFTTTTNDTRTTIVLCAALPALRLYSPFPPPRKKETAQRATRSIVRALSERCKHDDAVAAATTTTTTATTATTTTDPDNDADDGDAFVCRPTKNGVVSDSSQLPVDSSAARVTQVVSPVSDSSIHSSSN